MWISDDPNIWFVEIPLKGASNLMLIGLRDYPVTLLSDYATVRLRFANRTYKCRIIPWCERYKMMPNLPSPVY